MSYKIEFSKKAFEDLELIKKYIYENDELATQKIVSYIVERIETIIANNPGVGRAGRVLGTRELVLTKYPYIIPYFVKDDIVYIIRVLHTSRKWLE